MKIAEANGFDRSNGALDVWLADRILENDILKGAIVRCTGKADIVLTVMTRAMTRQRPYLTSDSLNVLNELAMNRTQEFSDALNRRLLPSSIPDRCIEDFFGCDVSNASDGQFTGILYSYGPAFLQAYSPEIVLADGRAAALVSKLMECLEARYQGWKKDGSVKKKFGEGYCLILNAIVEFVRLARGANKAANIDWVVAHPGLAPLVYLCNETGQGPALLGFLKAHFNWPYGGWATFGNGGGCFNNVNGVLVYNGNYVNAKDYENFVDGRNITFKLSDKHINRTGKNQVLDTAIFNSIDPSIIERLPQVTAK
jgi:hypothetical protein